MKKLSKKSPKIILSGGGTGGHIYPAIAIADELRMRYPEAQFLFVGASDKMEMEKVPKAGYEIEGLWISGIQRNNKLANISFPFKLISSLWRARKIIKKFKPDVAIGTGGFASGPLMWAAAQAKVPILVQEQNSFPGITNKLLKNKAFAICTAYDNMEQFFPKEKIHQTGNPIRTALFANLPHQKQAKERLGLNPEKPVILSVGGSLGSRTLNNSWLAGWEKLIEQDIQLIWQTGKLEYDKIKQTPAAAHPLISVTEFIYKMDEAYAAADLIVSRAGAMAISELCLVGKPTILVPFPYAAEDHQTKNAENLERHSAAKMVKDSEAIAHLSEISISLIQNEDERKMMGQNILTLARPHATENIVDLIEQKLK